MRSLRWHWVVCLLMESCSKTYKEQVDPNDCKHWKELKWKVMENKRSQTLKRIQTVKQRLINQNHRNDMAHRWANGSNSNKTGEEEKTNSWTDKGLQTLKENPNSQRRTGHYLEVAGEKEGLQVERRVPRLLGNQFWPCRVYLEW